MSWGTREDWLAMQSYPPVPSRTRPERPDMIIDGAFADDDPPIQYEDEPAGGMVDPPNLPHDLDRVVHPGRHTADCCGPVQGPNNSRQNSMADLLAAHQGIPCADGTYLCCRKVREPNRHAAHQEDVLRAAGFGDTWALLDGLRALADGFADKERHYRSNDWSGEQP